MKETGARPDPAAPVHNRETERKEKGDMEKICIATRRRRQLFPVPDAPMKQAGERLIPLTSLACAEPPPDHARHEERISVELTRDQSRLIESHPDFAAGKAFVVDLEKAGPEGGQMVFSFSLVPLYGGRLMSPPEVCAMLRISRSFLAKLVKEHRIESYRLGRLRRFLLEDILHYLGHNRELPEPLP